MEFLRKRIDIHSKLLYFTRYIRFKLYYFFSFSPLKKGFLTSEWLKVFNKLALNIEYSHLYIIYAGLRTLLITNSVNFYVKPKKVSCRKNHSCADCADYVDCVDCVLCRHLMNIFQVKKLSIT